MDKITGCDKMFLLNDNLILDYKKEGLLDIEGLDLDLLHPTYYYFRLGKWAKIWDEKQRDYQPIELEGTGKNVLTIPARGYCLVQSFERFKCSSKVLAIFGQISALPRKGLRLNHSPSIDPNFTGYLELGLENLLEHPVELEYKENIGKIMFFNISETFPVREIQGTISEKEYKRREHLRSPEPII